MSKTYKTYKAIDDTIEIVKNMLLQADLLDGLSLNQTQLKNASKPIFWYINTRSKEASDKETYISYTIQSLEPHEHGDGIILSRVATVNVNIFTRRRNVDDLIKELNDVFVDSNWTFELQDIDYDSGLQFYTHTFSCQAVLVNEEN